LIEVTSGAALLWRMAVDSEEQTRERNERLTFRIVGAYFLSLAAYIAYESVSDLLNREAPQHSIPGIILAYISLIVMPILSRAKQRRRQGARERSHERRRQTGRLLCLSVGPPAGRSPAQRGVGMMMGRSGGGADYGSDYRKRARRWTKRESVRRLLGYCGVNP
jgi:hypothetical protein